VGRCTIAFHKFNDAGAAACTGGRKPTRTPSAATLAATTTAVPLRCDGIVVTAVQTAVSFDDDDEAEDSIVIVRDDDDRHNFLATAAGSRYQEEGRPCRSPTYLSFCRCSCNNAKNGVSSCPDSCEYHERVNNNNKKT